MPVEIAYGTVLQVLFGHKMLVTVCPKETIVRDAIGMGAVKSFSFAVLGSYQSVVNHQSLVENCQ